MSGAFSSCNDYTMDTGELLQIGKMRNKLKKEKGMLKESLLQEKCKNTELIQRLESDTNAASEACLEDKKYIAELERELKNCSQEIGYLQEQLNLRTVEADCMGEHVHSLELKLAEFEKLHDKFKLLTEELEQANSKCLILTREIKHREDELQNSYLHAEKLETTLSSIALESQCEIESLKLDITALEQRCFEAERFSKQAAQDKDSADGLLEEFECKFQEAQERISFLEKENNKMKEKLVTSERNGKGSSCKVEHLDNCLKLMSKMCAHMPSGTNQDFLIKLREEFMLLKEMGTYEEVLGLFLSKLAIVTTWDDNVKNEMEKLSNQIYEFDLTIKKLKEELSNEKQKAKEEAEDLIQAMAELRYQMMGMLEEECKRRACIEQASLQRIQDLEAQIQKEQKKSFAAHKRFQEAHELVEMRSLQVRHLKKSLERVGQSTGLDLPQEISSCSSVDCTSLHDSSDCVSGRPEDAEASEDNCEVNSFHQARIEWYPDEAPPIEGQDERVSSGARTNDAERP